MKRFKIIPANFLGLVYAGLVFSSLNVSAQMKSVAVCIPVFREETMSLVMLTANDQGFFAKRGLRPDFHVTGKMEKTLVKRTQAKQKPLADASDRGVAKRVGSNECAIGTSTIDPFVAGRDDFLLGTTQPLMLHVYSEDYDTNLVVLAGSKINSLKDLKNKKVRLGQVPNRLALQKLLAKEGMSLADLTLISGVTATSVLPLLVKGDLDAAVTYVPTMPYMLASGKVKILRKNLLVSAGLAPVPHSVLLINKKFRSENPEVAAKFIEAMTEAVTYLQRNPSQVVLALGRHNELLKNEPWNPEASVAERSGAFIGKINLLDLTQAEGQRGGIRAVENYQNQLRMARLSPANPDLSPWLSGKGPVSGELSAALGDKPVRPVR